jgi:hypothetical protein
MKDLRCDIVKAVDDINLETSHVLVVPLSWLRHVLNPTTGKVNMNACMILADVVYWYRGAKKRCETTGQILSSYNRFKADLLQRNVSHYEELLGISTRQVRTAIDVLEGDLGVIKRHIRNVTLPGGRKLGSVPFWEIVPSVLAKLMHLPAADIEEVELPDIPTPEEVEETPPKKVKTTKVKRRGGLPKTGGGVCPQREGGSAENGRPYTESINTEIINTEDSFKTKTNLVKLKIRADEGKDHTSGIQVYPQTKAIAESLWESGVRERLDYESEDDGLMFMDFCNLLARKEGIRKKDSFNIPVEEQKRAFCCVAAYAVNHMFKNKSTMLVVTQEYLETRYLRKGKKTLLLADVAVALFKLTTGWDIDTLNIDTWESYLYNKRIKPLTAGGVDWHNWMDVCRYIKREVEEEDHPIYTGIVDSGVITFKQLGRLCNKFIASIE